MINATGGELTAGTSMEVERETFNPHACFVHGSPSCKDTGHEGVIRGGKVCLARKPISNCMRGLRMRLTDGDEKDLPPSLPPDLAARASPGTEKAMEATAAATANFLATSDVKTSHPFLPSLETIRRGRLEDRRVAIGRVSDALVPERCLGAESGTNALTGLHNARRLRAKVLILRIVPSR